MPSKYPCCSDCGTKLTKVLATTRFPNEFRVRFYFCKVCKTERVVIRKKLKTKDGSDYWTQIYDFVFSQITK